MLGCARGARAEHNRRMIKSASAAATHSLARSMAPVAVLALVWGCNWPMLKIGVNELAPLTFRAITLPFAALGMLAVASLTGDNLRIPRHLWGKIGVLAALNISGWNGIVLFGVQQLPAGRSVILAFTMPIWAMLIARFVLREPLSPRKLLGLLLGTSGMALLIGDEIRNIREAPFGAVMVLTAAIVWALGTVLLNKWRPALPQNTLSGWMMLLGWLPLAVMAPLFDAQPLTQTLSSLSAGGWVAVLYNVFLAGTIAHWAWFRMVRTLPVAVSSLSSLPVPIVGVFAGIVVLHERPGLNEWLALALVVLALLTVLLPVRASRRSTAASFARDDSG